MEDLNSDTDSFSDGSNEESWEPTESEYSGSESVESDTAGFSDGTNKKSCEPSKFEFSGSESVDRRSTKAEISEEKNVDSSSAKRMKVSNDSKDRNQGKTKGKGKK